MSKSIELSASRLDDLYRQKGVVVKGLEDALDKNYNRGLLIDGKGIRVATTEEADAIKKGFKPEVDYAVIGEDHDTYGRYIREINRLDIEIREIELEDELYSLITTRDKLQRELKAESHIDEPMHTFAINFSLASTMAEDSLQRRYIETLVKIEQTKDVLIGVRAALYKIEAYPSGIVRVV